MNLLGFLELFLAKEKLSGVAAGATARLILPRRNRLGKKGRPFLSSLFAVVEPPQQKGVTPTKARDAAGKRVSRKILFSRNRLDKKA